MKGKRFGKLTVICHDGEDGQGRKLYLCKCDCGNERTLRLESLTYGTCIKSCTRCTMLIKATKVTRHGMFKSPTYKSWQSMKTRCTNTIDKNFEHYGARGITVCDRWLNSFENFYEDMGDRPEGLSLDRIDNNGNYEKSNCKWSTRTEQGRNQNSNRIVTYNGKDMCLMEAVERYSKHQYSTVHSRLRVGWSIEDALEKPIKNKQGEKDE